MDEVDLLQSLVKHNLRSHTYIHMRSSMNQRVITKTTLTLVTNVNNIYRKQINTQLKLYLFVHHKKERRLIHSSLVLYEKSLKKNNSI